MSNITGFVDCPCCHSPVYHDLLLSHIFYEHSMTFYLWANFYYPGVFILSPDDDPIDASAASSSYEALSQLCDNLGYVKTPVKDFEASTATLAHEIRCPICLEDTTQNRSINNCGHEYCEPCLRHWFELNHVCPVCKITANPVDPID